MQERVVIVGSEGFVGTSLAKALGRPEHDVEVISLSRRSLDITSDSMDWALDHADVVVNAAGSTSEDLKDLFMTNVYGAAALAQWCAATGVRRLIHLSSGSVLEGHSGDVDESFEGLPKSPYALSKHLGEQAASLLFSGGVSIIRLFYPYGRGQRPQRLFTRLADAIQRGEPIQVNQDGGPAIQLCHIDDAARLIVEDFVFGEEPPDLVNLASDHVLTVASIAERLGEMIGRSPNLVSRREPVILPLARPYRPGEWRQFTAEAVLAISP